MTEDVLKMQQKVLQTASSTGLKQYDSNIL